MVVTTSTILLHNTTDVYIYIERGVCILGVQYHHYEHPQKHLTRFKVVYDVCNTTLIPRQQNIKHLMLDEYSSSNERKKEKQNSYNLGLIRDQRESLMQDNDKNKEKDQLPQTNLITPLKRKMKSTRAMFLTLA